MVTYSEEICANPNCRREFQSRSAGYEETENGGAKYYSEDQIYCRVQCEIDMEGQPRQDATVTPPTVITSQYVNLEDIITHWNRVEYAKYCCFCVELNSVKFLSTENARNVIHKLGDWFVQGFLLLSGPDSGYILLLCPGQKASQMKTIKQCHKFLKTAFKAAYENNLKTIYGCDYFDFPVIDTFKLEGTILFKTGEVDVKHELNWSTAADFCLDQKIFSKSELTLVYKRLFDNQEISPDKKKDKVYDRAVCQTQFDNANAVFNSGNPRAKIAEIISLTQDIQFAAYNKRSHASNLFQFLDKHKMCCVRALGFRKSNYEDGVMKFLIHNHIDPNYFFMCFVNLILNKKKIRRNIFIHSPIKDVGKTTLAHALAKCFPENLVGTVKFAKYSGNTDFMLHTAKNRAVCVTDDVTDIDLMQLEANCDILDGEVKTAMNSKFGGIDLDIVCPQIFTSNFNLEKNERLQKRLEAFLIFRKECLKDFCDYDDLECGIATGILNLFAFAKFVLITEKVTFERHLEMQIEKEHYFYKDSPDFFSDVLTFQKLNISFKPGASANLDRLTVSCQGESFDWWGLDVEPEDN